ncbi:MAG: hypothetical protein C0603_07820 [Denitrovibrio sp.]|nr:MAG: hypothetical protein C0603_07820 [Denitrovibrio sp.]
MPPKKTGTPRKTTTRKPAAKKTAAKRPATKKPTRRSYKRKKQDKRLPILALIAVIPAILLLAFVALRFSGGQKPAPVATPKPKKEIVTKTVIKQVESKSVINTIKLFMFDRGLRSSFFTQNGSHITIKTSSEKNANSLTTMLKKYLSNNKITVDGDSILTAEDKNGIYNIAFVYNAPPKKIVAKKVTPKQKAVANEFKAKLAVVIDDCGYNIPLAKQLAAIEYPVTFAVIPYTPYGKETAKLAKKSGKTVFIHFPMQPKSYPKFDPGKGALLLNMPETIIAAITKSNFRYFPVKLDGANNHTGSAFTESSEKMHQALRQIKKYTPAFLDSYTSGQSVAYETCQKEGMKCAVNNVFIDNEEPGLVTINDKKNHVHDQLIKGARKALKNGSAIAIGHLKKGTVYAMNSSLADIERMGVQIVPVTSLMH